MGIGRRTACSDMPSIGINGKTSRRGPKSSIKRSQGSRQESAGESQRRPYQAEADAASVMPWDSSQRSASMAALQPSAAAVTAWR